MNNHSAISYEATERRKMQKVKLLDIIEKPLSGEWGSEAEDGNGVLVLRTTNFTNEGIINFNSVVRRDLGNKNVDKKYLKKGDIIIEKSGGSDNQPVGRVVYFEAENNKYLFNNFTSVLRVKTDIAFPKYIFYCLFYKYKIGATRPFENKTTGLHNLKLEQYINSILITLPPIEEQRAIAEKLDKISQLVDKRKEQLQQLDQLVKSQFIDMFGDPVANEKLNGVLLKDIAMLKAGKNISSKNIDKTGDYPCYGGNGIRGYVKKHSNEGEYCLIGRQGALCGNVQYVKGKFYATEHALVVYLFDQHNVKWFYYCLKYLNLNRFQSGAAQPGLTVEVLNNVKIPLPPINLQNKFAEFVEGVDKLKEKVNNSLTQLNLLKQSLMQQYFG